MTPRDHSPTYFDGVIAGYGLVWPLDGPAPRKAETPGRGLYDGRKKRIADQKAVRLPGGDLDAAQRLAGTGWLSPPQTADDLAPPEEREARASEVERSPEQQAAVRAAIIAAGGDPDDPRCGQRD